MQAIERYGVVALLLLIATVVAVLVWDGSPADATQRTVAAADEGFAPQEVDPYREAPAYTEPVRSSDSGQLRLSAPAENRPLLRQEPESRDSRGGLVPSGYGEEGRGSSAEDWGFDSRRGADDYADNWDLAPQIETAELRAPERRSEPEPRETYYEPEPVRRAPVTVRTEDRPRPASGRRYKIKKGDTLGEIALAELGTSKRWREIVDMNPGLNEKKLFVGKEILLPGGGAAAPAATQPKTELVAQTRGVSYTVQTGDNLWKIARKMLGDRDRWVEIRDLNPNIDHDKILVGQKLILPADARQASQPIVASGSNTGTARPRRVR